VSSRPIVLSLAAGRSRDGFVTRLAGIELWSDVPLVAGASPAPRPPVAAEISDDDDDDGWQLVHDGPALDLGALRRVRAWRDGRGRRRIDYEDGESYRIAGGVVARRRPGAAADRVLERALGAPLALALAERGIYLLHAAALATPAGAVALAADSGVGKSTLAAAAAADTAQRGWTRIADDLLPVRLGARPEALPHFPQLKLAPAEQYPAAAAERLPLAAVVELDRLAPAAEPPASQRLGPAAAALALARATAAARLFDGELLAAHLAACAAAAECLAVARLSYPGGLGRLGAALDRLAAELAGPL
jgi:hypothetical protein